MRLSPNRVTSEQELTSSSSDRSMPTESLLTFEAGRLAHQIMVTLMVVQGLEMIDSLIGDACKDSVANSEFGFRIRKIWSQEVCATNVFMR